VKEQGRASTEKIQEITSGTLRLTLRENNLLSRGRFLGVDLICEGLKFTFINHD